MGISIKNLDSSEHDRSFPDNPVLALRLKCPGSPVIVNRKNSMIFTDRKIKRGDFLEAIAIKDSEEMETTDSEPRSG